MANVTKTNGRLLYIEPNDLVALEGVHSFNGSAVTDSNHHVDGHFWNPEDLNMSVDLQVIMPNMEDCGQHSFNEIFTVEITNDNSTALGRYISFMQGSDIEGKTYNDEVTTISNDLTTSYLNASYQEMYRDKKSDKESLGIESVDITFDSHFYPQVNIKFIDVRGYSLMMPTDMAYIGDQKARKNISDNVAGQFATGYNNFFRALFRFPYPRFLLTIKGYYGNSITFILAVNEFKNNFNSETGNFEVTVSFIGYMYGLYTDIPLNFLICAPYYGMNLETEKEHWAEWDDADYKFDNGSGGEGNRICTFIEYLERCDKLNKKKDEFKSGETEDTTFNDGIKWQNEINTLNGIVEVLSNFTKSIKNGNHDAKVLTEIKGGHIVGLLCLGETKETEIVYDKDYWNEFVNKYEEYESNAETKLNASFMQPFFKDGALQKNIQLKTDCDGFYIKSGNEFIENSGRSCPGTSTSTTLSSLSTDFPTIYGSLVGHPKRDWPSRRISFVDVYKKINNRISDLNMKVSSKATENTKYMNDACVAALGFIPTINNYFRMLFAHMDCFMRGFYGKLHEIKTSNRKLSSLGISREMTDLNACATNDSFVPPFAAFFKQEDNKRVEVYPGSIPELKNMPEVVYIENLLSGALAAKSKAKDYIAKGLNDKNYNDESKGVGSGNFNMIAVTDILYEGSNPYSNFTTSPNDDDMFGELLYFFTCRYLISKYQCGEDITNIGVSEAANYTDLHKNVPSKKFKEHLLRANGSESVILEELKNFYNKQSAGSLATVIEIGNNNITSSEVNTAIYFTSDKKGSAVYYKDKSTNEKLSRVLGNDRKEDVQKWKTQAINSNEKISDRVNTNASELDYDNRLTTDPVNAIRFMSDDVITAATDKGKLANVLEHIISQLCEQYQANTQSSSSSSSALKIRTMGKSGIFAIHYATFLFLGAFYDKMYGENAIEYGTIKTTAGVGTSYRFYVGNEVLEFFKNNEKLKESAIDEFNRFSNGREWKTLLPKLLDRDNEKYYDGNLFTEELKKEFTEAFFPGAINKNEKFYYFYDIVDENNGNTISVPISEYLAFVGALYNVYGKQKSLEEAAENNVDETDITENYKLEAYNALKNLYDKWINSYSVSDFELRTPIDDIDVKTSRYVNDQLHYGSNNGHRGIKEYDNFVFIDSFYNDISSRFKINPDTIYKLIADQLDNKSNYSVYEFMADVCQKNRLLFLALPVLNNFYSKNGLENIFRPQIENTMKRGFGSTYVCMYTYEVSHVLEDESQTSMCDDGITDLNDIASNAAPTTIANLFNKSQSGMPLTIPAFGVTYARQNQQYFKNINVNMDNPRVTDYSIANLFELANWKNDGTLEKPYTIANDVYSIYANRSYNCSVEMLGCANIMPLMYFQLNNIPMFRGAYIITNVEHHIRAGNFSTLFTGVRVSRNQLAFNDDIFNIRRVVGTTTNMDGGLEAYNPVASAVECSDFDPSKAVELMMGTLCNRDGTKCAYPSPYATSSSGHWCATAVSKYISVALGYDKDRCRIGNGVQASGYVDSEQGVRKYNFELIPSSESSEYTIPAGWTRAQRQQWTRENALPGDVACMYDGNYSYKALKGYKNGQAQYAYGHVCMYSGDKWVSDFGQSDMYVYNTSDPDRKNLKPIYILRHKNCHKKTVQTTQASGNHPLCEALNYPRNSGKAPHSPFRIFNITRSSEWDRWNGYGINITPKNNFTDYYNRRFTTHTDAVSACKLFILYIKEKYFDVGRNTPKTIIYKYCPPDADENKNNQWCHYIPSLCSFLTKNNAAHKTYDENTVISWDKESICLLGEIMARIEQGINVKAYMPSAWDGIYNA